MVGRVNDVLFFNVNREKIGKEEARKRIIKGFFV